MYVDIKSILEEVKINITEALLYKDVYAIEFLKGNYQMLFCNFTVFNL